MGRQKIDPLQHGAETGPQFAEGGLVRHVLPGDAVEIGEDEPPARRFDQAVGALDDLVVFHPHQSQGAGTVPGIIGGFKVQGHKGGATLGLQKLFDQSGFPPAGNAPGRRLSDCLHPSSVKYSSNSSTATGTWRITWYARANRLGLSPSSHALGRGLSKRPGLKSATMACLRSNLAVVMDLTPNLNDDLSTKLPLAQIARTLRKASTKTIKIY